MSNSQVNVLKALDIIAIVLGFMEIIIALLVIVFSREAIMNGLFSFLTVIAVFLIIDSFKAIKDEKK